MQVHADVLKMAGSKEKRERIEWFHARRVFFFDDANLLAEGLALARQCEHEDARFLVSLFPDGAPSTVEEAESVKVVPFPKHTFPAPVIEPAVGAPVHNGCKIPENSSAPISGVDAFLFSPLISSGTEAKNVPPLSTPVGTNVLMCKKFASPQVVLKKGGV